MSSLPVGVVGFAGSGPANVPALGLPGLVLLAALLGLIPAALSARRRPCGGANGRDLPPHSGFSGL